MIDIVIIVAGIIVLSVAYALYQRQQERNMIQRIKQSGDDPSVAMNELDRAIQHDQESAEFWKKQSGRRL